MPTTTKQAIIMALIMACSGLGGVLYGYDIGVSSRALVFMQNQYAPKVMDMTGMPSHAASMLATLGEV